MPKLPHCQSMNHLCVSHSVHLGELNFRKEIVVGRMGASLLVVRTAGGRRRELTLVLGMGFLGG